MRIISVAMLGALLLAGCAGGENMARAASVPASNGGVNVEPTKAVDQNPQMTCLFKCRNKADEKSAKCLTTTPANVCNDAYSQDLVVCTQKCPP